MLRKVLLLLLVALFVSSSVLIAEELILWDQKQSTEKIVKMFNEKMAEEGKDIQVKLELIPYDQMVPKFMASLSTGRAPDLYGLDIVQFPYFISIGAFTDITEWARIFRFLKNCLKG